MAAQPKRGRTPESPPDTEAPSGAPERGARRWLDVPPEIIEGVRRRDLDAFEALYRVCVDRVRALCTRLCGNRERGEDLTQEVFLRVWERIEHFEGRSHFSTWLYRVAVNRVTDALRSEMRREARETSAEDLSQVPQPRATRGRRIEPVDLERALASLPSGARLVFVLHDVEGYRHAEIAAMTGVAVGTSKAQLHRARRMLRQSLRDERNG